MNKQELIKKLKELLTTPSELEGYDFDDGYDLAIESAIVLAEELDEQGKVVVPKFVADWYEENKDYFEWNLYNLCVDFHARKLNEDLRVWFRDMNNKPIETLVMMHKFGYEVEKEKLYLASFRDTNQYLGWSEKRGEWFMSCSPFTSGVEQTRETWEGVRIWDNPAFEIKEVKE